MINEHNGVRLVMGEASPAMTINPPEGSALSIPEMAAVARGAQSAWFDTAFAAFMAWYQDMEDRRYGDPTRRTTESGVTVTAEPGSKYIRIVVARYSSRSSACFVRKSDGAVLKCAGWKAPFIAKGGPNAPMTIRGSIFDIPNLNPARWA